MKISEVIEALHALYHPDSEVQGIIVTYIFAIVAFYQMWFSYLFIDPTADADEDTGQTITAIASVNIHFQNFSYLF